MDNGHPPRIIICSATGDWIEFEKPGLPEEGDCPHGGCRCTPTLFERADAKDDGAWLPDPCASCDCATECADLVASRKEGRNP